LAVDAPKIKRNSTPCPVCSMLDDEMSVLCLLKRWLPFKFKYTLNFLHFPLTLFQKTPSLYFCVRNPLCSSFSLRESASFITGYSVLFGLALGMYFVCSQAFGSKNWDLIGLSLQRKILIWLTMCIPISWL